MLMDTLSGQIQIHPRSQRHAFVVQESYYHVTLIKKEVTVKHSLLYFLVIKSKVISAEL